MSNYQSNSFLSSIPIVTRNILIINFIIWIACYIFEFRGIYLANYLALYPIQTGLFRLHQLITFMFTQVDPWHMFFNMFAVYMFGRVLEQYWGAKRFLIYYMVCGIGSGLIQLLVCYLTGSPDGTIGASGAVFGILLAFGMLFPNVPLFIMFVPIPIKAKYFVIIYGVIELYLGFSNRAGDNVAHFAHLGGMLFGIGMVLYWKYKDKKNGIFRF
ncbi:rhomboid family intramembrane serine protease [Bacteroidales bacterium OttesenSCG-928-A17]|nr:rhomboid family intramembrane serine protease [Bacteroidales bacterium OttesenSCG-928-A17]